jgi:hypothetical protein
VASSPAVSPSSTLKTAVPATPQEFAAKTPAAIPQATPQKTAAETPPSEDPIPTWTSAFQLRQFRENARTIAETYLKKLEPEGLIKLRKQRPTKYDKEAYEAGWEDGQKVDLKRRMIEGEEWDHEKPKGWGANDKIKIKKEDEERDRIKIKIEKEEERRDKVKIKREDQDQKKINEDGGAGLDNSKRKIKQEDEEDGGKPAIKTDLDCPTKGRKRVKKEHRDA